MSVFWECSLLKDSKCKMGSFVYILPMVKLHCTVSVELGFDQRKQQRKCEHRKYLTSISAKDEQLIKTNYSRKCSFKT